MRPGNVIAALFYLRVTSLRNAVIARVARLKEPKYLVGAIVGVAYVYWLVFGRADLRRVRGAAGVADVFPLERLPTVAAIAALLLTLFVVLYWLWPRSRAALTFSEAEIAFLFPAPISRKTLIHFRWISTQLRILFTSLLLGLVSAGWTFVPGNAALRIVGFWLLLSTLDLHVVGASFTLTRLLDRGMTSLRRSLLTLAVAAIVTAAALAGTWRALRLPAPGELGSAAAVMDYVAALLATVPLAWLITPARWIVQPLLAPDLRAFLTAIGPAFLVYAVHYIWVLRSEVSFEEASLAKAEKRAARRNLALREGTIRIGGERTARRAPFKLAAAGRPEIAFLWKNLLASASYLQRPRAALIAAALIVVGSFWLARLDLAPLALVITMLALVGAGYTVLFGPMIARQDLRHDLRNTDILKTYPLPGWQLVLGEVLAPVTVITVLVWLQLLTAVLNFHPPGGQLEWLTVGARSAAAIGIGLTIPFLSAVLVLMMNAAVLLFPAWMPQGGARTGIDVMGQSIFFFAAFFVAILAVLLPVVVAAAAIFFMTLWLLGPVAATVLGLIAVLIVLGAEIAVAVFWLGKRFESFDLSAELRA